jgi:UDP-glucose 4-epimerase
VLVTGAAGFIGSHVVNQLVAAGYMVRVVDNLSSGKLENLREHLDHGAVDFVKADIRDSEIGRFVEDVDACVHLAAIVSVPFSVENPTVTYDVNVVGTRNLLSACAEYKVKRFVFISSCAVYGEPTYLPVDEFHPTNPLSPYASSKLEGEFCCREFHKSSGMNVAMLRLFNVYGPRQGLSEYSGVVTKFFEAVREDKPLTVYGDGSATRDFVHVSDVASAVLTLVRNEKNGVFNIGTGKAVTITDLAKTVLKISDKDLGINYLPARRGDIAHSFADTSKARSAFGYSPKVALEEGLRDYFLKSTIA